MNQKDKVSRAWDCLSSESEKTKRKLTNFSGLNSTHEFHNYLVSGKRDYHYLLYFKDKYLPKERKLRMASLGCGDGNLERNLIKFGYSYDLIDAFDINKNLLAFADREKEKLGYENLNYILMDLNNLSLEKSYYDLIIFFHSLHHVENLESVLEEVKASLKQEGILLVVDFVGPNRMQWKEEVIGIAQEMLDIIPEKYRLDLTAPPGEYRYKTTIKKPTVQEVVSFDPSEAVRSGDILDLLYREFRVIEEKPTGGTLIDLVFNQIAGNFNENDDIQRSLILSLQKTEELLLRSKVIKTHYVFLVAKK